MEGRMIDTTRIRTGFDVELLLGAGWFRTALQGLADIGTLLGEDPPPPATPNSVVVITAVEIIVVPADWDLRVNLTVDGFPVTVLARLSLNEDGTELIIETDLPGVGIMLPFDVLHDLAGPPTLTKVPGEDGLAPAIAVLANLDIRSSPQFGDPLPPGEHEPRGEPLLAQSFLSDDMDIAFGMGRDTFPRLANDIWHTELTAEDGSHPLPNEDDPKGTWKIVRLEPQAGLIRLTLLGEVPIDLWPDAAVTVEIDLRPSIANGVMTFEMQVDSDVDTGILGDILAGLAFGLVGLLVGSLFGGGIGFVVGVIVLEVVEVIIEGRVERKVRAEFEQGPPGPVLSCRDNDMVVEAFPRSNDGIALGPLNAIPRSIPFFTDQPDPVHERTLVVNANYAETVVDGSGFAAAGTATIGEWRQPLPVTLVDRQRALAGAVEGELTALVYQAEDDVLHELALDEVLVRVEEGEIVTPLRLIPLPVEADVALLGRRLAPVCLTPTNVRRAETVVTDIRFSTGLDLRVSEAVLLQDAGALVVRGVQLIHPRDADPYFRAFADATVENNFENLPQF
jgi:hypothetical protein